MQRKFFYCGKNLPGSSPCPKTSHRIKSGVIKTVRQSKPNSFDYTLGIFFATIPKYILFQREI